MQIRWHTAVEESFLTEPAPDTFSQTCLVRQIENFGYLHFIESLKRSRGSCAGITAMWVQSVVVNEEFKFFDRVVLIKNYIVPLADKIADGKPGWKDASIEFKVNFSNNLVAKLQEDKTILQALKNKGQSFVDILAFFDGIRLYHEPYHHREFFAETLSQEQVEEISKTTAPLALEKEMKTQASHVCEVYSESFIYNDVELKNYFAALLTEVKAVRAQLNKECKSLHELAITLCTPVHRIGLRYDNLKNKWILVDPNQLPLLEVDFASIASEVKTALFTTDYTAFTAKVFLRNSVEVNVAKEVFIKFKNTHTVTAEIAKRKSHEGATLAYLAAASGDVKTIQALLAFDADINIPYQATLTTPLHIAAQNKKTDVVRLLLDSKKVKITPQDLYMSTPIARAIESECWLSAVYMLMELDLSLLDSIGIFTRSQIRKSHKNIFNSFINLVHQTVQEDKPAARKMVTGVCQNKNALAALFREDYPQDSHGFFSYAPSSDPRYISRDIPTIEREFQELLIPEEKPQRSKFPWCC